jgi:hypothetical protein
MSILDNYLVFSDEQALAGADTISDVIDRGSAAPTTANIGGGFAGDLFLVIQTGPTYTVGTGTSVKIDLASDSTADLATSPTTHWSQTFLSAALAANTLLAVVPMPPGDFERYIGLKYDVTGTYTALSINAFLTRDPQYWRAMSANNPVAV